MELRAISSLRLWLWLSVLLELSICSPLSQARTLERRQRSSIGKRQGAYLPVVGAGAVGDGTIQPRLEIRELEKNADQWNVYLLGLLKFQKMDQREKLSWYQVAGKASLFAWVEASDSSCSEGKGCMLRSGKGDRRDISAETAPGIHGRPYIPWDAAPQGPGDSGGGYCPHSSNIFPTWHRPYLALFEVYPPHIPELLSLHLEPPILTSHSKPSTSTAAPPSQSFPPATRNEDTRPH